MKKIKRILFVETANPGVHVFSLFKMPRLGAVTLATILEKYGYETRVIMEEQTSLTHDMMKNYDAIAISCLTSSAPRSYKIAEEAKKMGKITIIGGPHTSFMADEALNNFVDYVLRGESEETFPVFLDALNNNKDLRSVDGLSFISGDEFVHNKMPLHAPEMDSIPLPNWDLIGKEWQEGWKMRVVPVMTSRGCPFHCTFCTVTQMFGKKYRIKSIDKVMEELVLYDHKNYLVFFYDDNFAADKKHTKKLLNKMIEAKLKFKWIAQVRADIGNDEELLDLMYKAGCIKVFIGFESVDEAALKLIKKSQTVEKIQKSIEVIKKHKISIHGMFIFGIPGESIVTMKNTVRFALKNNLESAQFLVLTPFPGTEEYYDYKNRNKIRSNDFSLYDAHHVVIEPSDISAYELQKLQLWAHKKFYSKWQNFLRILKGQFVDAYVGVYARNVIKSWEKNNSGFVDSLYEMESGLTNDVTALKYSIKHFFDNVPPKVKLPMLLKFLLSSPKKQTTFVKDSIGNN